MPVLTTLVNLGSPESPRAWLELSGLNITTGTDAGLRYAGGYSQRGLIEVSEASNVWVSNCTVSEVSGSRNSVLQQLLRVET